MKLFAIYVGGEMEGANIELHDMRFVIADRIEDTYPELRRQWWGTPASLHLDCWSELTHADGYRITLKPQPANDTKKLYYINLGGYDPKDFSELHKNVFIIAETEQKAKLRALKTVRHWQTFHVDDMFEAEQVVNLNQQAEQQALYIHLEKIDDESQCPFHLRLQTHRQTRLMRHMAALSGPGL